MTLRLRYVGDICGRRASDETATGPSRVTRPTTPRGSLRSFASSTSHHTTPRAEQHACPLGDRPPHDAASGARGESTDPQTDRGALRLDQAHRRRTQAPLQRQATKPSLVPHDRSRLQHHQDHRPGRRPSVIHYQHEESRGFATGANPGGDAPRPSRQDHRPSRADLQHPARKPVGPPNAREAEGELGATPSGH